MLTQRYRRVESVPFADDARPKVLVIYVGGTLGMFKNPETGALVPRSNWLQSQMLALPELHSPEMPAWSVLEYSPILDSSDMDANDWATVASDISAHYWDFSGFVLVMGTDTLAYAACFLSFALVSGCGSHLSLLCFVRFLVFFFCRSATFPPPPLPACLLIDRRTLMLFRLLLLLLLLVVTRRISTDQSSSLVVKSRCRTCCPMLDGT